MALDPNGKYLRQTSTGAIFGWCQEFAKRGDMVPYRPGDDVAEVVDVVVDTRRAAPPVAPSDIVDVVEEPALTEPPAAVTETPDGFGALNGLFDSGGGDAK